MAKTFNDLEVGTILYAQYGYSMVLYNFYEIVGKTKSSVKIRLLNKKYLGNVNSWHCPVKPMVGEYAGPVMTKRIGKYGNLKDGSVTIFPYAYNPSEEYAEDHMD